MSTPLKYYIYDIETLFNFFSFAGKFYGSDEVQIFEISARKNQKAELLNWLSYLQNSDVHMVGFNSVGFDYAVLHELLNNIYTFDYKTAWNHAQLIIRSQGFGVDKLQQINQKDRIIPQIDLFKINHFDNMAKTTSLKALQFAMRSQSVEDMPVRYDVDLTFEQMDLAIKYNIHDVSETEQFLKRCEHLIDLRKDLLDNGVLSGDVLNFADTKIGVEYLIKKIGRAKCFQGNKSRQTFRTEVAFRDVILPKIKFRTEEYQQVLDWFNSQTIYLSAEEKPSAIFKFANIDFHFGLGGVHASVNERAFHSDSTHVVKDIDVTGMYVAVAIANGFAPEHLGNDFSIAYKQLQSDRSQYKKGTSMNAVLKLAGNGVYGNSNNKYSCFYDPKYTFTVTANGQLQIMQLVEVLAAIPGLEIIQANTDGITVKMRRDLDYLFQLWKTDWESQTGLKLEEVDYSSMWIRDVNNYLAVTVDGKIKRKGAYFYPVEDKDYEGIWNKDFSAMVVQKVASEMLINGWNPEALVRLISDPFDFMLRYKTPKESVVYIGDQAMQKTVRYYVSTKGQSMKKISIARGPVGSFKRKNSITDEFFKQIMSEIPTGSWDERIHTKNKSVYDQVTTGIESGWLVKECNRADKFDWSDVDYSYYVEKIKKLDIRG